MRGRLRHAGLLGRFAATSLLVIALLGVALGSLIGRSIEAEAVRDAAVEATQTVTLRVLRHLTPEDLRNPMTGARYTAFARFVQEEIVSNRTARIKVWAPDGTVIFSNDAGQVGERHPLKPELEKALRGEVAAEVSELQSVENKDERQFGRLLEVYAPIVFPGSSEVAGSFEIYQFYTPTADFIASAQRSLYTGLAGGLLLLYTALFTLVKQGHDTIRRQESALEDSYQATLEALSAALDLRDGGTEQHSRRAARRTRLVADALGIGRTEQEAVLLGALLHDVGKIGVPDAVLLKAGPLTAEEWRIMRQHPVLGEKMLAGIPSLANALPIVRHHHERWDGSGYPDGLKGNAIPLGARVFAVIDSYDAINSDRPYRPGRSQQATVEEITRCAGTQYDPAVVAAFRAAVHRFGDDSEPPARSPLPALGRSGG